MHNVLLVALILLQLLQPQVVRPVAAGKPLVSISVEESMLTMSVYPDGSVTVSYKLRATATPLRKFNLSALRIHAKGFTVAEKTFMSESVSLTLTMPSFGAAAVAAAAPGSLQLRASSRTVLGPGLRSEGHVEIAASNRTSTVRLTVDYALRVNETGVGVLGLRITPEGVKNATGVCTGVCKRLESLEAREWVESVTCNCSNGVVVAEIRLDLRRLLTTLVARGLSPSEVDEIMRVLREDIGAVRSEDLSMRLEARGGLSLDLKYTVETRGPIERLARMASRLQRVSLLLQTEIAGILGYRIPSVPAVAVEAPTLTIKPPFRSRFQADVKPVDDRLDISVDYTSPRYIYIGATRDPVFNAKKTLEEIAKSIRRIRIMLVMLEGFAEGASDLIPAKVRIVGVNGVRVEPSEVPLSAIDTVRVEVSGAPATPTHTTTTAARTTTTSRHTATTITPTTTTRATPPQRPETTTRATSPAAAGSEAVLLAGIALAALIAGLVVAAVRARR